MLRRIGSLRLKPKREPTIGQSESPVTRHPSGIRAPSRAPTLKPTASENMKLGGMYPDMVASRKRVTKADTIRNFFVSLGGFVVVFGGLVMFDGGRNVFPEVTPQYMPSYIIGQGDRFKDKV